MHVLDYYFSKKNNYAFSNKNYKLEKLVIKKTLFYDDISTSTLRAMHAQTPYLCIAMNALQYITLIDCASAQFFGQTSIIWAIFSLIQYKIFG